MSYSLVLSRVFVYHRYRILPDGGLLDMGCPLYVSDCGPQEPEPRPFDFADRDEEYGCDER